MAKDKKKKAKKDKAKKKQKKIKKLQKQGLVGKDEKGLPYVDIAYEFDANREQE